MVAISLGGNQSDSRRLLESALAVLTTTVHDLRIAPLFRTPAISDIPQPYFLNTAATGSTELSPEDLLAVLKALERGHGRRRSRRWGPRPLDIDLLTYGDTVVIRPELHLPHPRLRQRRFYLEPLAEIVPDLEVPPDGATVADLLAALPPDDAIVQVPWAADS